MSNQMSARPIACFCIYKNSYRFAFNGQEQDNEISGTGNTLDFGARVFDSRIGRFLSVDCRFQSLPSLSCYSNSANSPIFLKDVNGEYPKVAIIITNGDERGFEEHKIALEKQGYVVVSAKTGEEALKCMNQYSTPESPTSFLVLLSHGSPGGVSSNGGGIWTESELEIYTKNEWESKAFEQFTKMNGIVTDYASPDFDRDKYDEAMKGYDDWKSLEFEKVKDQLCQEFKEKYGVATTSDISNEIKNGGFEIKNLTIIVGGCNMGGYNPPDNQAIFSTELAIKTGSTVFSSRGYTSPDHSFNFKTSDKIGTSTSNRTSTGTWLKTDSNGNVVNLNTQTLNIGTP